MPSVLRSCSELRSRSRSSGVKRRKPPVVVAPPRRVLPPLLSPSPSPKRARSPTPTPPPIESPKWERSESPLPSRQHATPSKPRKKADKRRRRHREKSGKRRKKSRKRPKSKSKLRERRSRSPRRKRSGHRQARKKIVERSRSRSESKRSRVSIASRNSKDSPSSRHEEELALTDNKFSTEWSRTGAEVELPIPPKVDMNFLIQLFNDKTSSYGMTLYEEHAVRIQLIAADPKHFLLRGPSEDLSVVARQLQELLSVPRGNQRDLLAKYEHKEAIIIKNQNTVVFEPKVSTSRMDFTKLAVASERQRDLFRVPSDMVPFVCTANNKRLLFDSTGVDVEYNGFYVTVIGATAQRTKAHQMLKRVITHCKWGISDHKVLRLLDPTTGVTNALCRLSPMSNLPKYERSLTEAHPKIFVGKGATMDLTISNHHVSRRHCVIELDLKKRGTYLIDCSTNGTFLNGRRVPPKRNGKVLLSHGDELNLKDPRDDPEFGYIVNFLVT